MNSTRGISVDTREVLALALAGLEDTINVRSRGVVLAANTIEDVLAVVLSVGTSRVANLEAEHVATHEAKRCG